MRSGFADWPSSTATRTGRRAERGPRPPSAAAGRCCSSPGRDGRGCRIWHKPFSICIVCTWKTNKHYIKYGIECAGFRLINQDNYIRYSSLLYGHFWSEFHFSKVAGQVPKIGFKLKPKNQIWGYFQEQNVNCRTISGGPTLIYPGPGHSYYGPEKVTYQWGTFYLLTANFLLHKIYVVLKSLWSFCD